MVDHPVRTAASSGVAAVTGATAAGFGDGDRVGAQSLAGRYEELQRALRAVVADVDGLGRDIRDCTDFAVVSRVVEAAQALHRAVLVLGVAGGSLGGRAGPVAATGDAASQQPSPSRRPVATADNEQPGAVRRKEGRDGLGHV
jgi:hypothetical protein